MRPVDEFNAYIKEYHPALALPGIMIGLKIDAAANPAWPELSYQEVVPRILIELDTEASRRDPGSSIWFAILKLASETIRQFGFPSWSVIGVSLYYGVGPEPNNNWLGVINVGRMHPEILDELEGIPSRIGKVDPATELLRK